MAERMKAQVFYEPLKMQLEERDKPEIAPHEILVEVKSVGICGSDVAYYFGDSPLETPDGKGPLVLGHEFSGVVAEVGAMVAEAKLFSPGERVVLDPVQYCNACEICKRGYVNLCENKDVLGVSADGGFAGYCKSHYTGVHRIPEGVSFEHAALTEPLACATYGVQNMKISPGNFCVVIGAGAIGLMMLQLVKSSGAGKAVLVDILDYRLELGKELGADEVINTGDSSSPYFVEDLRKKIEEMTGGKFADRVITPTGSVDAMETALAIAGRRSIIVYFGLPGATDKIKVPALDSIFWDKTIRFSWLAPFTWPTALQALAAGLVKVDQLVTHKYALKDLERALGEVKERKGNVVKAVVTVSE
ncbi:alcohol dehydrogenase catalytic domain-containing protein [bacterium]|nr:alcohol dehydrogenase catalytic domain-containing protein [bacterium]